MNVIKQARINKHNYYKSNEEIERQFKQMKFREINKFNSEAEIFEKLSNRKKYG